MLMILLVKEKLFEALETTSDYVFVDTDYTIVKTSLSFDNNLYRLEYNFIDNNSAYQVTAIVSADYKVQEILVTQGLNKVAKLDYVYTGVAEIVWPN